MRLQGTVVQNISDKNDLLDAQRLYALLVALAIILCALGWALYVGVSALWVAVCALVTLGGTGAVLYLNRTQLLDDSNELHARLQAMLSSSRDIVAGKRVDSLADSPKDMIARVTESIHALLVEQQVKIGKLRITDYVFTTAGEAILVSDVDGKIVDVNPQLLKMTGYTRDELIAHPAGILYRNNAAENRSFQIRDGLIHLGHWRGETVFFDRSDCAIPVLLSVSKILDDQGMRQGYVSIFADIRHTKEVEARLRQLTTTDRLTTLPNYVLFSQALQSRLANPETNHKRFLFLVLNIDRLRTINDRHGPENGDKIIAQIAAYLEMVLPNETSLCRRSGDEFMALVDVDQVQFIDQFKAALSHIVVSVPTTIETQAHLLSLSAGGVVYPDQAKTLNELLLAADAALQLSKLQGRARLTWFTNELGDIVSRRRLIEERLAVAITADLVKPFYQPEIDMRTGKIIGFEALARWDDEILGSVSPGEFILIAEESRLIERLSGSLLSQVLRDLPTIVSRFPRTKVAFNASPHLFRDRTLLGLLTRDLRERPEILNGLEIEVTESHAAESAAEIFGQLKSIRTLGVEVAIDDFGTGYSSFARLANMPINRLKIDSSFIAAMQDATQKKITVAIINLAKTLELEVTAEGVERAEQRSALLEAGCHRAQGWLYAKALPLNELLKLESVLSV
jgi:diguanylate cyclase (GGDEF)-like protein/PAS domain S-box-containing protein